MNKVVGELCLPQEDPGGERHPLNRSKEQGGEEEDMSSTSFTDQLFMSLQSFYRTFSGSLRNISEEHKKFLYNHLRKLPTNFYLTGFSPHTEVEIINNRLLGGTFYKQSCLILGMELNRRYAEVGFIDIICKPNTLNEDQQQEDLPFHLEENVVPNCQLHNINNIDSNCLSEKWQHLLKLRRNNRSAIAGVFIGDDLIKTFHAKKQCFLKGENTIHYEELLIREIDPYLEKISQEPHNGVRNGGRMDIFFYIPISPCFKREKKKGQKNKSIVPCFFLLLEHAAQWQKKYNCYTDVRFTNYFGPLGLRFLEKIPKSEIWRIDSVFYPYTEKSENVYVKLDCKKINNKFQNWKIKNKLQGIQGLNTDCKNCQENLSDLAKSELKLHQHLIRGLKIITSSEFDPTVKDLIDKDWCEIWADEVGNKGFELIMEEFAADFNKKFAEMFLKHQNFSSRECIKFTLLEKDMLQSDF